MYDIFKELLDKNKCRAADVAKATGISQTVFSEWKKGKSNPKIDKLQKIADFFGVGVEYFIGEKTSTVKEEPAPYITLAASRKDGYDKPLTPDEEAAVNAFIEAYRKAKHKKD